MIEPEAFENTRRLMRVPVSRSLLIDLLRDGHRITGTVITENGIPDRAMFIGCHTDVDCHEVYFLFAHESFKLVPLGERIPELVVTFRSERP